jgi:hypothetical protein
MVEEKNHVSRSNVMSFPSEKELLDSLRRIADKASKKQGIQTGTICQNHFNDNKFLKDILEKNRKVSLENYCKLRKLFEELSR